MSKWSKAVFTTSGLSLQAKLISGTTLVITKAVAGTGTVDESALASQTAVTGPISSILSLQSGTIDEESAKCKLPIILTNDNVSTACVVKQIGVYANDPDNGEILFFIVQDTTGLEVPSKTESPGYSARWNFYVEYGQADNVTVTVDPSSSVSRTEMESYVSSVISDLPALESHVINENNPHNVTKYQVGLGNVDNTSDENKPISTATQNALNGKAASDLSNVSNDSFVLKATASGVGDVIVSATSTDGAAYTATVDGITSLKNGMSITIIPDKTSSNVVPTLDLNGLGAKSIKQRLSVNTSLSVESVNTTWMVSNKPVPLIYDGTQWVTITPRPSADDMYGEVDVEHGGTGATTAEQARINLGIKDSQLLITVTKSDSGLYSADKNFEEMLNAYDNGQTVIAIYNNSFFYLSNINDSRTQAVLSNSRSDGHIDYLLATSPDNWTILEREFATKSYVDEAVASSSVSFDGLAKIEVITYTGSGTGGSASKRTTIKGLTFPPKVVFIRGDDLGSVTLIFDPSKSGYHEYAFGFWPDTRSVTPSSNTVYSIPISYQINGAFAPSSYFVELYCEVSGTDAPKYQFNTSGNTYTLIAIG